MHYSITLLNGKIDKLEFIHTADINVNTLYHNWNNLNFSLSRLFTLWNRCNREAIKDKFPQLHNVLNNTDKFISKIYLKRLCSTHCRKMLFSAMKST